jgi:hypothetical protein
MTDKREKSQWTKERKIKYLEKHIHNIDIKITDLKNKLDRYILELRELRYKND